MKSKSITYYGGATGDYGMPETYHTYLVTAKDDDGGNGAASAFAMAMSQGAPEPRPQITLVKSGGVDAALETARRDLSELPENRGLKELVAVL